MSVSVHECPLRPLCPHLSEFAAPFFHTTMFIIKGIFQITQRSGNAAYLSLITCHGFAWNVDIHSDHKKNPHGCIHVGFF
jgi:hypothetical protein